ncbi:hypothetical protein BJ138DRAFT_1163475 [Hygrophoropsis aurantiaca]|uniref:Uncharacterized protein n=1 Tax=Hygrophoropsis aurantiaca TaxID=72124 RepID=A0ACB7ZZH2_9AGAM|nr:hypothetical protein BJ138DRAFT_1163475 [Hygrophoropsis aurantiaca]
MSSNTTPPPPPHSGHNPRRESQSGASSHFSSSSRSGRSHAHPAVESAVTRLLVAIKQLLESLTLWSTVQMTETQVSDVYVRLVNDFNAAVAAFAAFNIDMSDLMSVPEDLREILETCLAEEATQDNLQIHLPKVRQIITNLLNGLRGKQSMYRQIVSEHQHRHRSGRSSHSRTDSRSSRSDSTSRREGEPKHLSQLSRSNALEDVRTADRESTRQAVRSSTRRQEVQVSQSTPHSVFEEPDDDGPKKGKNHVKGNAERAVNGNEEEEGDDIHGGRHKGDTPNPAEIIAAHTPDDADDPLPNSQGEPQSPSLDSILNLPATSEPCDPAPEYVRGQAATMDTVDPHEEQTRTSEPVTPVSQNIWDFEEESESEMGPSERKPSFGPPATSGSSALPPTLFVPCTPSVHVSPSINNSPVHPTNHIEENTMERPTIVSSPPDPATKTPETLDPAPTQSNMGISSKFWSRVLGLVGRRSATQQQSNVKRSSSVEMHTVAGGRGRVLIYGEPAAETEEETPLSYSVIPYTPQARAPSIDSQASGILDTSQSEEKLGLMYYICYCKCS